MNPHPLHHHARSVLRLSWGVILYLLGFAVLLTFISHYYLLPALNAAKTATPAEKHILVAHARLILVVFLFVLLVGLMMTFRVARFFFPQPPRQQIKPTTYSDAWAESARRMG
jgi:hypothetical protein